MSSFITFGAMAFVVQEDKCVSVNEYVEEISKTSSGGEGILGANTPNEIWGAIINNLTEWDCAALAANLPKSKAPVYQFMLERANAKYIFGCTKDGSMSYYPCTHDCKAILQRAEQYEWTCPIHLLVKCPRGCDASCFMQEEQYTNAVEHAEAAYYRKRQAARFPGCLTDYDYLNAEEREGNVRFEREYLVYNNEVISEQEMCIDTMFRTHDALFAVEKMRGGADAAPGGGSEVDIVAPTPPEPEEPDDDGPGPAPEHPDLPPHESIPVHPAPEVPADPPITNGDNFGPIPNTEEAADPLGPAPTNGWFEYPFVETDTHDEGYSGLIKQSKAKLEYYTELGPRFATHFPFYNDLKHKIISWKGETMSTLTIDSVWGFGPRVQSSFQTQTGLLDQREQFLWTTNTQSSLVTVSEDTILYDNKMGLSVADRGIRLSTTFNPNILTDLQQTIGDRTVASRYNNFMSSSALPGDSHVAFLTIAYTRLIALKVCTEQNTTAQMRVSGQILNRNTLCDKTAINRPMRRVVDAILEIKPNGAILLPRDSSTADIEAMMYLMGHGRIQKGTAEDEEVAGLALSPFDRFVPDRNFKLVGILNGNPIEPYPQGDYEFDLTFRRAQDLLTRYVNENGLWDQMAVARNTALAMVMSRSYAALTALPRPNHAVDLYLHTMNTGANYKAGRRVMSFNESMITLITSGSWHCHAMEETLFETIVNTMEETAGIGPRSNNFLAAVDTRQDDLALDYRIAMVALPVVERMTGTPSNHLHQYVGSSTVEFIRALSLGWEDRPIRISSYLALGIKPEDKALNMFWDHTALMKLYKQETFTWRESVAVGMITGANLSPTGAVTRYNHFWDSEISEYRSEPPSFGAVGRNEIKYLTQKPEIWDFYIRSTPIKFIQPKGVQRLQSGADEAVHAEIAERYVLMKELLEAAALDNAAEDSDYESDDEDRVKWPTAREANHTPKGVRMEVTDVKGKGKERELGTKKPEEKRGGLNVPETSKNQWQKPKITARVDPEVAERALQRTRHLERAAAGDIHYPESDSHKLLRPPPKVRAPPANSYFRKKQYDENLFLNEQMKRVRKERYEAEKTRGGGSVPEDQMARRREEHRDAVSELSSRVMLDRGEREKLLRKLPDNEVESKVIDQLFPRGKDGALKRAIYTIGVLLRKLKVEQKLTFQQKHDVGTFLVNGVGGKNAWAVGVVMFLTLHTLTPGCYEMLKGYGLLTTPYDHWNDKWGNTNDLFRNQMDSESWAYSAEDFPQCLYIAGFVGRPHRAADWEEEVAKRSANPKPLRKFGAQGFEDMDEEDERAMILDFLYAEAKIRSKRPIGLEKWYKTRAEWMIKGSMSGEKTVLDTEPQVMAKLKELGLKVDGNATKMHVAERVDYDWIKSVLLLKPVHLAKAHTKGQENGKIRSIQGSCYSHYVFGNYWSTHLESTLTLQAATMNKTNSRLIQEKEERRLASMDNTTYKVCADYPDFGATHSCRQQRLVLECVLQVAMSQGFQPDEEFMQVHNWYSQSFENQYWMQPDNYVWHRATTGMFSGVVQTTLINTIMNGALRRHYIKTLKSMGSPVSMMKNFELGDDGWAEFPTRDQAESYVGIVPLCGKDLNPLKQLISRRASEYLREWYINGTISGCASRALAMLVSGNVESNIASAAAIRIRELYESFSTLRLRYFNPQMCQYYFEDLAVYEVRHGMLGRFKVLRYLYGSRNALGMGLYPIDHMPNDIQEKTNAAGLDQDHMQSDADKAAQIIWESKIHNKFKASKDYVTSVEERYRVTWKHQGKARATATIAAQNVAGGNKSTQLQHEELEIAVLLSGFSKREWERHDDELTRSTPCRVSAKEIEKQFYKMNFEDQKLLAQIGQIAKIAKYMTEESEEQLARDIALENNIPYVKVIKAIRTLSSLKGVALDYPPRPFLSQELMGIYSQWKVVDKREGDVYLPDWLMALAPHYRT
ncbi:polyprotein [Hymenoscyphus fraxineus botybirnavirus 1]|nr:polyprotein [Hymenoscyphus fraxineus botybirnavirus 1]